MKCFVCGFKPFSDKDLVQGYGMNLCHTCWVRLYAIDNGRRTSREHPELNKYLK